MRNISDQLTIIAAPEFWFMVSLFNGISVFVIYLMPKPSLKKNSSNII